jgi:uncharacterized protein (TIGR00255 family)
MTGFGRGSAGGFKVDARSSNHKNLDLQLNLPPYLYPHEIELKKRLRKFFSRGRIEIYVPRQEGEFVKLIVNRPLAREYYRALTELKNELSIDGEIGVDLIASQRDVILMDEAEVDVSDFMAAFDAAIEELQRTRQQEGSNLIEDVSERLHILDRYTEEIEKLREGFAHAAHQRLLERLKEITADIEIDETRLLQEAAYLVERADITEEIVRVKSHLKQFRAVIETGGAVGKKLDFIVQELRREVNTIGSKAQDVSISSLVVEMKHELEKIREQIQNLQ